eukprot:6923584-Prymnesium_polylepis.1
MHAAHWARSSSIGGQGCTVHVMCGVTGCRARHGEVSRRAADSADTAAPRCCSCTASRGTQAARAGARSLGGLALLALATLLLELRQPLRLQPRLLRHPRGVLRHLVLPPCRRRGPARATQRIHLARLHAQTSATRV